MPRVSILLTCYNHIKYLPIAFQSILDQTFQDYEIIALDDGSTDGTRQWLESQNHPRLKLIFNESNLGTYGTLNVGLQAAQGEFIAVFNDDDVWLPTKLEQQIALLDSNPKIGLVHTDGYFIDGEGLERHDSPLGFDFPRTETGDILLALIYANSIIASAVLAHRECFDQLGGFNPDYFGSGDWEMWYRIAEHWHVGYIADPLTLYRVHGANASHKLDRIWRDDLKLRTWISPRIDSYTNRFTESELTKARAHNFACLGTVQALTGDPQMARISYRESLRFDPTRWKSRARILATYLPAKLFRKLL
ncbi:hypothetical protein CCB80_14755 [Armatimonadetes bacterium Uphvl-Ar1]|nr:hypothetical protein CCB80_14755 [Armatimonadetes bacterium Uphvl-Ar1]